MPPKKKPVKKKPRKKAARKKAAPKKKISKAHATIIEQARTLIPGYDPWRDAGDCVFDAARALRSIELFESKIIHVKGELGPIPALNIPGKPYILAPHERAIMANIFGWYRPDGSRRYREVFYFVARKNSKTTFVAGLLVLITFFDEEPGAENYCAAADADQADIAFDIAKQMVLHNKDFNSETYKRSVINTDTNSFLKVLSSAADTKRGQNSHTVLLDELLVMDQELVDVLITSQGSRRQPLAFYTTTSDFERESICNMMHKLASDIRDGTIKNPYFLPVIFEADKDDDWKDEKVWLKANPNLGRSVKIEYLRSQCAKAQVMPTFENTFKREHLNIRTEQESLWIPMDLWRVCGRTANPVVWRQQMIRELKDRSCAAGLDLGSTSDLSALVLAFQGDGHVILIPYFWMPQKGVGRKHHEIKEMYTTWINQGFITTTPGHSADYSFIRKDINQLIDENGFGIQEIACDRLFQGHQLMKELVDDGIEAFPHGQGFYGMAAPTKTFEEHILEGKIEHGGNPVLTWMAGNSMVEIDSAGNMKVVKSSGKGKSKKQYLKVDGIVASVMALGRLVIMEDMSESMYDNKEIGVWL